MIFLRFFVFVFWSSFLYPHWYSIVVFFLVFFVIFFVFFKSFFSLVIPVYLLWYSIVFTSFVIFSSFLKFSFFSIFYKFLIFNFLGSSFLYPHWYKIVIRKIYFSSFVSINCCETLFQSSFVWIPIDIV